MVKFRPEVLRDGDFIKARGDRKKKGADENEVHRPNSVQGPVGGGQNIKTRTKKKTRNESSTQEELSPGMER